MTGTAFPDLTIVRDPGAIDPLEEHRSDPASAIAVLPDPVPAGSVSDRFRPAPGEIEDRPPEGLLTSAHFLDRSFRWTFRAMAVLPPQATAIEIARWPVPAGSFGVISAIWTHIGLQTLEGFKFALNLPPLPWFHENVFPALRWWLRYESSRAQTTPVRELAPIFLQSASELPGDPAPELASWSDQRFAWGWHGRQPLRLLVPESTTVRLFVGLDVLDVIRECRLDSQCPSGYICQGGICIPDPGPPPPEVETLSKAAARSPLARPGKITPEIVAAAIGAFPVASSEPVPLAIEAEAEEENPPEFAGRITGTIQSYRDNSDATRAARRGL